MQLFRELVPLGTLTFLFIFIIVTVIQIISVGLNINHQNMIQRIYLQLYLFLEKISNLQLIDII